MTPDAPASSGSGNSARVSGPSTTVSLATGSPPPRPIGHLARLPLRGGGEGPPAVEAADDDHPLERGPGAPPGRGGPEEEDPPVPVVPLDERSLPAAEAVDDLAVGAPPPEREPDARRATLGLELRLEVVGSAPEPRRLPRRGVEGDRFAVPLRAHGLGALARPAPPVAARRARARAEDERERADAGPVRVRDRDGEVEGALDPQPIDLEAVEPLHGVAQRRGRVRVLDDELGAGRLEADPVRGAREEEAEELALGQGGRRGAEAQVEALRARGLKERGAELAKPRGLRGAVGHDPGEVEDPEEGPGGDRAQRRADRPRPRRGQRAGRAP